MESLRLIWLISAAGILGVSIAVWDKIRREKKLNPMMKRIIRDRMMWIISAIAFSSACIFAFFDQFIISILLMFFAACAILSTERKKKVKEKDDECNIENSAEEKKFWSNKKIIKAAEIYDFLIDEEVLDDVTMVELLGCIRSGDYSKLFDGKVLKKNKFFRSIHLIGDEYFDLEYRKFAAKKLGFAYNKLQQGNVDEEFIDRFKRMLEGKGQKDKKTKK